MLREFYSNEADRDNRLRQTLQVIFLKVAVRITGEKTGVIIATMRAAVVMMMVITTCHSFSGAFERLSGVCLSLRRYFRTIFLLFASSQLCTPYARLPLHLHRSVSPSGTHAIFYFSLFKSTAFPNQ